MWLLGGKIKGIMCIVIISFVLSPTGNQGKSPKNLSELTGTLALRNCQLAYLFHIILKTNKYFILIIHSYFAILLFILDIVIIKDQYNVLVISTDPGPRPPDFKSQMHYWQFGVVSQYLCLLYLIHKTGFIFIATSWANTWQHTERIASGT